MRFPRCLIQLLPWLLLAGCASAPVHYYTLLPPAATSLPAVPAAALPFELLTVGVPAQADQPQLVVRQGDQGVAILDGERWAAPLADEVHGALASDLARALPARDVTGVAAPGQPVLRVKVDLRRFDAAPGDYASIDAAWSLRVAKANRDDELACTSRVREPVGAGYPALVDGYQQALDTLAQRIAQAARSFEVGQGAVCPAD